MPKKVNILELKLTVDRPKVEAIWYACTCNAKSVERCDCKKYLYITGDLNANPPEKYRVTSGLVDIKQARTLATEWEVKLKREERELAQRHAKIAGGSGVTVEQLFTLYEDALASGQDAETVALKGECESVGKIATERRVLCGHEDPKKREWHEKRYGKPFLEVFNALPPEKRFIEADRTIAKLERADQITGYWMAHIFRPVWFDGAGTANTIGKRKEHLQSVWHHAHKLGVLEGIGGGKMCKCPPCCIVIPRKMRKKGVKPTPPLELWQYKMALDTCALYEESSRDPNPYQLRCSNERLRLFLAIMANTGARRIDTALMAREGLSLDRKGEAWWTYVPLKNGDPDKPLVIPFPRWLYDALLALPPEPEFFHRDFFFFSGPKVDFMGVKGKLHLARYSLNGGAKLPEAPDPWARAIKRVVELMPEAARKGQDERNKLKSITPHMFRDTFAVECYVQGMSDRQIADAIFDTEEMVKKSYSPYHDRKRVRDSVDSMEEGVRYVQEALADLEDADRLMRRAGVRF